MNTSGRLTQFKKMVNLKVLLITTLIFCFCFCFHWVFFLEPYKLTFMRVFSKILHFVFLYSIIYYLNNLIKNIDDPKIKCNLICAGIFFAVMMIFVLLTWPGTWSCDDVCSLYSSRRYEFHAWQHFLTNILQILCLQTFPHVAGVPIVQSFLAALIVGYVVSNFVYLLGKTKKQRICLVIGLLLITLFPPQVVYLLSGYRMGMYMYLELLLVGHLFFLYKNKIELSWWRLVWIGVLTVLLASWRSEAIYYPIVIFFILLIYGKKYLKLWKNFVLLGVTLVLTLGISVLNTSLTISEVPYSLSATISPVVKLLEIADLDKDAEELKKIDKVLDVDKIRSNPKETWEYLNPDEKAGQYIRQYTGADWREYLFAYVSLSMKYPKVVLKFFLKNFAVSGFGGVYEVPCVSVINAAGGTLTIFDENAFNSNMILKNAWDGVIDNLKSPINKNIRNKTIIFLAGSNTNNITIIYRIFWNFVIPFGLIFLCLVNKIFSKHWFEVVLILLVLIRIPVIFFTASSPWFMYYLPTYLCTYILSFVFTFEAISQMRENRKNKLIKNEYIASINSCKNQLQSINCNSNEVKKHQETLAKTLGREFLLFIAVSFVGCVVNFAIYWLLTKIKMQGVAANIIGLIFNIAFVFLLSNKYIFKDKAGNLKLNFGWRYLIYLFYQLIITVLVFGFELALFGRLQYSVILYLHGKYFYMNTIITWFTVTTNIMLMISNYVIAKILIEK